MLLVTLLQVKPGRDNRMPQRHTRHRDTQMIFDIDARQFILRFRRLAIGPLCVVDNSCPIKRGCGIQNNFLRNGSADSRKH
jgi:hypothetical protein